MVHRDQCWMLKWSSCSFLYCSHNEQRAAHCIFLTASTFPLSEIAGSAHENTHRHTVRERERDQMSLTDKIQRLTIRIIQNKTRLLSGNVLLSLSLSRDSDNIHCMDTINQSLQPN